MSASGPNAIPGWVWPSDIEPPRRFEETAAGELVVRHPHPESDAEAEPARALLAALRHGRSGLASIPAAELIEMLGDAGEAFVRDLDGDAVHEAAANAGLSAAMLRETIGGMAQSWGTAALRRLVTAEFPDPRVLDGFVPGDGRRIGATGPGLTLHLGAGTVPGVTITSMLRTLLVKSPVLVKPGAGDVALTVRFARRLRRMDRRLASAVAVQYWPGGTEPWEAWERTVFRRVDQIVVYGGDDAIESVRARAPASTRLVEHPHRVGVAVVDPQRAPETVSDVARSAALHEQRGCVSTQLVLLVGDLPAARRWCADLAGALDALERALPPGPAEAGELSARHQLRGRLRMKGAASTGAGPGAIELWQTEGARSTVILAPVDEFEPIGGRTVWVASVPSWDACLRALAPLAPTLQTVGVAGIDADRTEFARRLCALGVTRMVSPRQVAFPAADWLHDGSRPLGELVLWSELR